MICGGADLKKSDLQVQGRFGLLHCCGCGLSFLDLEKNDVDEESFDKYWDSVNEKIYSDSGVVAELQSKYSYFFKKVSDDVPVKSLLDVGSGVGIALAAAGKFGFDCTGIEPSEVAAKLSHQRSDAKIICGLLTENIDLPYDFGLVTLWDVIEHVPDPEDLIRNCADHLRNKGIIMLETPDEGAFIRRIIRAVGRVTKWSRKDIRQSIYYRAHRFYFSRDAMSRLLERRGFEEISFCSWHSMFRKELLKRQLYHGGSRWQRRYLLLMFWVMSKVPFLANKMIVIARKP